MKYYYIQLLLVFVFFGCKSINIKDAYYTHVSSGIPSVKNKTTFSILIEVNKTLTIKSISLEEKFKVDANIELYHLLDGRMLDLSDELNKGDYFLQLSISQKLEGNVFSAILLYKRKEELNEIKIYFNRRTPNLLMKESDF